MIDQPHAISTAVNEEEDEGDDGEEGNGALAHTDSLASASSFWEYLLRPHYLRLRREDEVRNLRHAISFTVRCLRIFSRARTHLGHDTIFLRAADRMCGSGTTMCGAP